MKAFSLSFMIFILSLPALADRGDDHYQQMCQNDEVKASLGQSGTCNIIIASSKKFVKGICSGKLLGQIPCSIYFDTSPGENVTGMRVVCGEVANPILDQKLAISASVYHVNALIKTSSGRSIIKQDPQIHSHIQSALIDMIVTETPGPEPVKSAQIAFILNEMANPVTEVVCE